MNNPLLDRFVSHPLFAARESDYIRWYPKTLTPHFGSSFVEQPRPAGIYIHVPFCDKLCRFCPFNKQATERAKVDIYLSALLNEIDLYAAICDSPGLEFVYFGGGSPSVLSGSQLTQIIDRIAARFPLRRDSEISLEAHPTHLNRDSARAFRQAGINRISSGLQSFDPESLVRLGAQHTIRDSERAIDSVGSEFGRIAIDLLFRCPGQSVEHWLSELDRTLAYGCVDHVSMYSLVLKSPETQPPAVIEAAMTVLALEKLDAAGFRHYASCASGGFDLSLPGRRCVYEQRHWGAPQAEFLGLGPGALGYVGSSTTVNGLGLDSYTMSLKSNRLPLVSCTHANREEAMRRYFVLGIKTLDVPLGAFRDAFGIDAADRFAPEFSGLREDGLATYDDEALHLTPLGRMFVDTVSARFFSAAEAEVAHPEEPEIRRVEVAVRRRIAAAEAATD